MLHRASDRMHQNSLLGDLVAGKANLRSGLKSDEKTPDMRPHRVLVREAMRTVGLSQKEFAISAGTSESGVSDALAGSRALPSEWVWAQTSLAFHRELQALESAERGLTPEASDEIEVQQITTLLCLLLRRSFRLRAEAAS